MICTVCHRECLSARYNEDGECPKCQGTAYCCKMCENKTCLNPFKIYKITCNKPSKIAKYRDVFISKGYTCTVIYKNENPLIDDRYYINNDRLYPSKLKGFSIIPEYYFLVQDIALEDLYEIQKEIGELFILAVSGKGTKTIIVKNGYIE